MIKIWELDIKKKNNVREINLEKWKIGRTLTWVDCFKPDKKELEDISRKTGIPSEDLKESIDPNKRPYIYDYGKYSLVIFRGPYEINGEINTVPISFFIFKNDIISIYDKPIKGLEKIRGLPKKQYITIFRKGASYFIYRFISSMVDEFFTVMEFAGEYIDKIENKILNEKTEKITKKIFSQKHMFIYLYKALIANRDVVSAIEKEYLHEFKKEDARLFRDLYNDIMQLIDIVSTYRDILTSLLDMYISSVSNSLNKIMKILTVLSAFVLIPTLITGIYGMNFQRTGPWNMPELYWEYGYFFSIGLIILSVTVIYIWFKRKGWLGK